MSKKIGLVSVAALVFVVVLVAFAGSALAADPIPAGYTPGSHSNLVGGPHDLSTEDPCSVCHVTHGAAQQAYLWAQSPASITWPAEVPSWPTTFNNNKAAFLNDPLVDGVTYKSISTSELRSSDILPLCYSCHDGSGMGTGELGKNTLGSNTVLDLTKGMHRMESSTYQQAAITDGGKGKALLSSYGRDCDRCHDPHEDTAVRPNFIRYYQVGSTTNTVSEGANICTGCHGNLGSDVATDPHNHWTATVPSNGHGTVANASSHGLTISPSMAVFNPAGGGAAVGTRLFNAALEGSFNVSSFGAENGDHRLSLASLTNGAWPATATVKCESCHAPHGGAGITTADMSFTTYMGDHGPALKWNAFKNTNINTMDPADGKLCTNCHN